MRLWSHVVSARVTRSLSFSGRLSPPPATEDKILEAFSPNRHARTHRRVTWAAMAENSEPPKRHKLVGAKNFQRHNPNSDRFPLHRFHHVEFWCVHRRSRFILSRWPRHVLDGPPRHRLTRPCADRTDVTLRCHDAITTASRFAVALGMQVVAKSDMTTGNSVYASYVLRSNDLVFVFSAPYGGGEEQTAEDIDKRRANMPHSCYDGENMTRFITKHGLAVKAVGVVVDDAEEAHRASSKHGARNAAYDVGDGTKPAEGISEVELYGDVVMRFVSESVVSRGPFCLPRYEPVPIEPAGSEPLCYGLRRLDHAVGNVHDLLETVDYISNFTGMHEFAEFTAEDVGTVDSGLNSMVLANNSEYVLLPVNEPTFGTSERARSRPTLSRTRVPVCSTWLLRRTTSSILFERCARMAVFAVVSSFRSRRRRGTTGNCQREWALTHCLRNSSRRWRSWAF